jgi:hypothetical protein
MFEAGSRKCLVRKASGYHSHRLYAKRLQIIELTLSALRYMHRHKIQVEALRYKHKVQEQGLLNTLAYHVSFCSVNLRLRINV